MAITVHSPHEMESRAAREREESFLHFLARESQLGLRWAVGLSAAATVATMIIMFYWAILPAMVMVVFYVLLLIANYLEYHTKQPGDPASDIIAPDAGIAERADIIVQPREYRVSMHVRRRLMRTILGIVIVVALGAIIISGVLFGWRLLAFGALIVTAYWLFIGTPLWLGWLNDEAENETHRAEELEGE